MKKLVIALAILSCIAIFAKLGINLTATIQPMIEGAVSFDAWFNSLEEGM